MEYYVGQILKKPYPPEAAIWCNENGCCLEDIEVDGVLKVIITENPKETHEERKEEFLKKFFKVSLGDLGFGYYRKTPKGYQSAIESINTAQIMCSKMGGLPAGILVFYREPNFNKPEECTEEWLEQNQIILPALNTSAFDLLYLNFIQSWNEQEHL